MEATRVAVRPTAIAVQDLSDETVFDLVTGGDCSKLSTAQKLAYYKARCDAAGLDYRTTPFQFIKLSGKEVLYSLKAATDALAAKNGIRCEIIDQRTEEGIRIVTVRAACKDGRQTDEIGAVPIGGLKGEALANGLMKAATKAKRRAVLSVTGLGMTDETEIDSIPGAVKPTSDLPWAERASSQAAKGTKDEDLASTLAASLEVDAGAAPIATLANLPDASEVVSEDGAAPTPPTLDFDPDEAVLINEKDRRYLFACRDEGGHSNEQIKRWLAECYGVTSTKEIQRSWFKDICARLRDPSPLVAGDEELL
jgi:hypothetical protein